VIVPTNPVIPSHVSESSQSRSRRLGTYYNLNFSIGQTIFRQLHSTFIVILYMSNMPVATHSPDRNRPLDDDKVTGVS
jgi:hypothetical protein